MLSSSLVSLLFNTFARFSILIVMGFFLDARVLFSVCFFSSVVCSLLMLLIPILSPVCHITDTAYLCPLCPGTDKKIAFQLLLLEVVIKRLGSGQKMWAEMIQATSVLVQVRLYLFAGCVKVEAPADFN